MNNKQLSITINKVLWVLGILGALSGAYLLWNGHILGEDAASLGRTMGIIAVVLIGAAAAKIRRERK